MNKEDNNVKTTLTVTLNEPGLTAAQGTNATGAADYSNLTASGNITIDMDKLGNGNFTFKVNAPQGLTAPSMSSCTWLNITETHAWADADGQRYAEYQVEGKAGASVFADYTIAFTNLIPSAPKLNVTLKKAPSKPKFAANDQTGTYINSSFNAEPIVVADPTAATTSIYLVDNSVIYVKATCPESFTFIGVTGLTVTQKTDNIYEIKVTDATQFTAGSSTTLEAENSGVKSTLKITWSDPAIKISLAANTYVVESVSGNDIIYTIDADNLPGTGFEFTVIAPKGATTDLSGLSSTWIMPHGTNLGDAAIDANVPETYKLKVDDTSKTGDLTLTFTNLILSGGNQKIILRKK